MQVHKEQRLRRERFLLERGKPTGRKRVGNGVRVNVMVVCVIEAPQVTDKLVCRLGCNGG